MVGLTCNACNKEFKDESEQKLHYKSEWHRYNLKRKVAGVPGVTEALFQARQSALAEEQKKLSEALMLYECALCGKEYRSAKAHAQHLQSRSHSTRVSDGQNLQTSEFTVIKPIASRAVNKQTSDIKVSRGMEAEVGEDNDDEWEEVNSDDEDLIDETVGSMKDLNVDERAPDSGLDLNDMDEDLDPSCCFICDKKHASIETCMVHMHKLHGFFIPDIEYLKDPNGLLTYVGLKVKRDFLCLHCNERCQPFVSLESVRKHTIAKGHCKLRYGDGADDEEGELEEFYDYSSSYLGSDGKQIVAQDDMSNSVELGSGGSELVITRTTDYGTSIKTLGSREFMRYYRQKPRPSRDRDIALAISLVLRYRSMGLVTVQMKEPIVRIKVLKAIHRSGVEAMRTKVGMKNNVIRNLPKNVPY